MLYRKTRAFFWLNRNKLKSIGLFCFFFCFVLMMGIYAYSESVKTMPDHRTLDSSVLNEQAQVDVLSLSKGDTVDQVIKGNYDGISEIVLTVGKSYKAGTLEFQLKDSSSGLIQNWKSVKKKDGRITLKLNSKIENAENETYILNIYADQDIAEIVPVSSNTYGNGDLSYNGNAIDNDLLFRVVPAKHWMGGVKKLFYFALLWMFVFIVIISVMVVKKAKTEYLAIILLTGFGIVYMFFIPPFSVPDEFVHYATAYQTSNVLLGVTDGKEDIVTCRECDSTDSVGRVPSTNTYRYITGNIFKRTDKTDNNSHFVLGTAIHGIFAFEHLPQAIGISIARLLKMNYITEIYCAQFMTLLFFTVCVFFSIKLIPLGEYVILAICGMPIVMQQATSSSYDMIVCGISFLYIAYMLRMIYSKDNMNWKKIVAIYVLTAFLAPSKLIYFIEAFLVWLIPNRRFDSKRQLWICKAGVPVFAMITTVLQNSTYVTGSVGGKNIIAWANEEGYTLSELLSDIPKTLYLYLSTYHDKTGFYVSTLLGSNLGWGEISIPMDILLMSVIALVAAILVGSELRIKDSHRIWCVLIFVGVVLLACLSMLLGWTPKSYHAIEGVQGRYFLPALPLLMVAMYKKKPENDTCKKIVVFGSVLVNYLVLLRVYEFAVLR